METKPCKITQTNPLVTANPINKLFFWWTIKLFRKGAHGNLKLEDLYHPLSSDESNYLADRLEKAWNEEMKKTNGIKKYKTNKDNNKKKSTESSIDPSLTKVIFRTFGLEYLYIGILLLFQSVVLRTMQPILQSWIISYFDNSNESGKTKTEVLLCTFGLILCTLGITFIMHHMNLASQQIGMRIRVACCSLIYRKSLRLSKLVLNSDAAGQMINLLSNDVNRFDLLPMVFAYLWIMPIAIIIIGYIMWQIMGLSTFAGIGALLLMAVPLQTYISIISGKLREKIAQLTDRRIQLMSEIIAGIQVLLSEVKLIKYSSYLRGIYLSLMVLTERTTLFITLITYVFMGNTMTAHITFALAGYFNILQLVGVIFFPQALIMCGEAVISIKRIQDFLLLDEISNSTSMDLVDVKTLKKQPVKSTGISTSVSVELKRVSASWISGQLPPTLCGVSLKINGGQLCSIIGPVGSGKSSLINVLLHELPLGAGIIELLQYDNGKSSVIRNEGGFITDSLELTISYASQEPWLFSGTIRENILFGETYEMMRYQQITQVCSLLHDFKQLPKGDLTIVGDRGASLSGGQRARINLARAIYRQADLYLLDDPLSAVDTRVARHLFERCILNFLQGKTRILITHSLHFLKQADVIVIMEHGFIKEQGSFSSLKLSAEFNEILNQLNEDDTVEKEDNCIEIDVGNDTIDDEVKRIEDYEDKVFRRRSTIQMSRRISTRSYDSHLFMSNVRTIEVEEDDGEEIVTGKLSNQVFIRYFRKGGGIITLVLLVINFVLSQIVISGGDYWLSYWTNLETARRCIHDTLHHCKLSEKESISIVNDTLLGFYSLLDEDGLLPTNYAIYIYTILIVGCIVLSISRGRVLNRFSKDIGAMDEILPKTILEALQIVLVMIGVLIVIIIVNPWMAVPIIIIGIIFYIIQRYCHNTIQDIKRLESVAKSPVFSHVSTTLNGLSTIRSRGSDVQIMLCKQFDEYQNNHTSAWYLSLVTTSAFDNIFGGSVGLAISQSLILSGMLQYGIRLLTEVCSEMTAIERIVQYTDLPREPFGESSSHLSEHWLSHGKIQMKNVFFSYKKGDPPVLKNMDFILEAGWKVGIVGRTGAGKSSIIAAIFRLADDGLQGEILIDGKDLMSIGLEDLRTNISIIPQQPILFSESLRYNLDPFSKHSDDVLCSVLREVELYNISLDQWVSEGGTNFSVGQRQLICLARAILRNNRILILDEATANIDPGTDALIQRLIRSKFVNCTVITIAHRLNTIIDSDKVLVMENGRVVEFADPYDLLVGNPDGYFSRMVAETGEVMAKQLLEDAKTYHNSRLLSIHST
ncbi:hypothetical protein PV325_007667 [Microctonus aethiopoides]|nr:hypothetical protein PV325_007667 [Microctonus aethiopoides]